MLPVPTFPRSLLFHGPLILFIVPSLAGYVSAVYVNVQQDYESGGVAGKCPVKEGCTERAENNVIKIRRPLCAK